MNIKTKTLIILVILITIFSCNNIEKDKSEFVLNNTSKNIKIENEDFKDSLVYKFSLYGMKIDPFIVKNNDTLYLKLFVSSPSFIDQTSQKLIVTLISFELRRYLEKFNIIIWDWIDEGLENEIRQYKLNKSDLLFLINETRNRPQFVNTMKYLLANMTQNEYLYCNHVINTLHRLDSSVFYFNDNFWTLIQEYADNQSSNREIDDYFIRFQKLVILDTSMIRRDIILNIDSFINK
jgi:hypothetical protein